MPVFAQSVGFCHWELGGGARLVLRVAQNNNAGERPAGSGSVLGTSHALMVILGLRCSAQHSAHHTSTSPRHHSHVRGREVLPHMYDPQPWDTCCVSSCARRSATTTRAQPAVHGSSAWSVRRPITLQAFALTSRRSYHLHACQWKVCPVPSGSLQGGAQVLEAHTR